MEPVGADTETAKEIVYLVFALIMLALPYIPFYFLTRNNPGAHRGVFLAYGIFTAVVAVILLIFYVLAG